MNSTSEPIFGITLGWLPIFLIWLPLSIWLLRKIGLGLKPGPFKWGTLGLLGVVLAAIPVGDDAYIQWHFNRLCRDAGMHYEKKIAVDGYYDSVMTGPSTAGPITNLPAIESYDRDGFRFSKDVPGTPLENTGISHFSTRMSRKPTGSGRLRFSTAPRQGITTSTRLSMMLSPFR
jgi:hypothetical protein